MGSYGISTEDIADCMIKALDKLEGDFTNKQLMNALDVVNRYPYVSDKEKPISEFNDAWDALKQEGVKDE
jgi:hypothetical protein